MPTAQTRPELQTILQENSATVFDARPFMEYATSHIPGALNVAMLILATLMLGGCGQRTTPEPVDRLNVTVSILPQKYFVERIGGNHVNVNVMAGPGDEPHTYEPKPEQLKALSKAAAYFSIGVDFDGSDDWSASWNTIWDTSIMKEAAWSPASIRSPRTKC